MGRRAGTVEAPSVTDEELTERVNRLAYPLGENDVSGYDPLLDMIGDARVVLIGEASHGTHEFYRERALLTRRLIEEKGFNYVAIEGDWPEAYRINEWVKGGSGRSAWCTIRSVSGGTTSPPGRPAGTMPALTSTGRAP